MQEFCVLEGFGEALLMFQGWLKAEKATQGFSQCSVSQAEAWDFAGGTKLFQQIGISRISSALLLLGIRTQDVVCCR